MPKHAEFTDPPVLSDFILLCQEIKYLFLLEFFFIFICITATESHTGQTGPGGRNIEHVHVFLGGPRGRAFLGIGLPRHRLVYSRPVASP